MATKKTAPKAKNPTKSKVKAAPKKSSTKAEQVKDSAQPEMFEEMVAEAPKQVEPKVEEVKAPIAPENHQLQEKTIEVEVKAAKEDLEKELKPSINDYTTAMAGGVGRHLTAARRERKLTISQVSSSLNIRYEYIVALEEDNYENLPGKAYVQGFIKSYAKFLNLNPEVLLSGIRNSGMLDKESYSMPEALETSVLPSKGIIIASLVVVIVLWACWNVFTAKEAKNVIEPKPTVKVEEIEKEQEFVPIIEDVDEPAEILEETPVIEPKEEKPVSAIDAAIKQKMAAARTINTTAVQVAKAELKLAESSNKISWNMQDVSQTKPANIASNITGNIRLVATDDVWLQVRKNSGRVLFSQILESGKEYTLPSNVQASVDIGKPEALEIYVGETLLGKMGSNSIIRGLQLDPAMLMASLGSFNSVQPAAGPEGN